jgi:transcription termination factor NusB
LSIVDADSPSPPADPLAARILALDVLMHVEEGAAHADVTLAAALAASSLPVRDRALASRLVYGTLAWQARLDWQLARLTDREPTMLNPHVRMVLRLGLYQITLLDRVPPHAAVGTSVDLAKRTVRAASGLVNAVLRRAVREKASLPLRTLRRIRPNTSRSRCRTRGGWSSIGRRVSDPASTSCSPPTTTPPPRCCVRALEDARRSWHDSTRPGSPPSRAVSARTRYACKPSIRTRCRDGATAPSACKRRRRSSSFACSILDPTCACSMRARLQAASRPTRRS